ncbi:carboxypeptidase-like regulatory domain-containing protein [Gelidibacter pelagius]|uniref:Carboxypeptidase regulatory-like domain-containing protein n=1 Tax=Gelidibacter pelagius TaxID=2819985 RepID=A0ABS3SVL3_9FLAO|nr:carboxypeptidase-like regulatory domain-containing protein [Gelidibacter pelagius]MBO3099747.1 carboxypeptidase regulatory-like domain-containing protein [Gelidibacter pelagius]
MNGSIIDVKGEPISYANIVFVNLKTEEKVGTISSEDDGKFSIELSSGEYILEVSVLGYSKYIKRYSLTLDIKLPDIVLRDQNQQLDEVMIKAEISKNIEHTATSIMVNIQNDSLFKQISTADVLSLLPGVQIDEDGGVKLQGRSALITINGKPNRMSSLTFMMLLESMQGDHNTNIR